MFLSSLLILSICFGASSSVMAANSNTAQNTSGAAAGNTAGNVTSLTAYKVTGNYNTIDFTNESTSLPASSETFWNQIPWTEIPLQASDAYGGHTGDAYVKVVNNGSWIFLLAQWNDTTQSRLTDPVLVNPNGGYVYNSTYYYGDLFWFEWSLMGATAPPVPPYGHTRFAGTPGSGDAGLVANLWRWSSYEDPSGPTFPYHYYPPSVYTWGPNEGQPLVEPYGIAFDSYLNASAQYFVGTGVMRVETCAAPLPNLDPFVIRARGIWSNASGGFWTMEMARAFVSPPNTQNNLFDIQLQEGQHYWVGFLVANGNDGEVYSTNSRSQWIDLYLSPQSPHGQQVGASPPGLSTAGLIYVAAIVVAVAVVASLSLFLVRKGKLR